MIWIIIILSILVLYLLWRCHRITTWIEVHEPWLAAHHVRGGDLEKAVCQLEDYTYRNPIDTSLIPNASDRFCTTPNQPPTQGWGGSPPPDGF